MCPTPSDYSNFQFSKKDNTYARHGENATPEYGQVQPDNTLPDVQDGHYPNPYGYGYDPQGNRQFSQDKENDPKALLESTRDGVKAQYKMNEAFGLNCPVAGPGVHAWLRDPFAGDTSDANVQPGDESKIPFRKDTGE